MSDIKFTNSFKISSLNINSVHIKLYHTVIVITWSHNISSSSLILYLWWNLFFNNWFGAHLGNFCLQMNSFRFKMTVKKSILLWYMDLIHVLYCALKICERHIITLTYYRFIARQWQKCFGKYEYMYIYHWKCFVTC